MVIVEIMTTNWKYGVINSFYVVVQSWYKRETSRERSCMNITTYTTAEWTFYDTRCTMTNFKMTLKIICMYIYTCNTLYRQYHKITLKASTPPWRHTSKEQKTQEARQYPSYHLIDHRSTLPQFKQVQAFYKMKRKGYAKRSGRKAASVYKKGDYVEVSFFNNFLFCIRTTPLRLEFEWNRYDFAEWYALRNSWGELRFRCIWVVGWNAGSVMVNKWGNNVHRAGYYLRWHLLFPLWPRFMMCSHQHAVSIKWTYRNWVPQKEKCKRLGKSTQQFSSFSSGFLQAKRQTRPRLHHDVPTMFSNVHRSSNHPTAAEKKKHSANNTSEG